MDLLFSLSCVDKFQLILLIVSMWDIESSFSKPSNIAEGKYFLVLLLWAQTKSSSTTNDCLRHHWLLFPLPSRNRKFISFPWFVWTHSLHKQLWCCVFIFKEDPFFCCIKSIWIRHAWLLLSLQVMCRDVI